MNFDEFDEHGRLPGVCLPEKWAHGISEGLLLKVREEIQAGNKKTPVNNVFFYYKILILDNFKYIDKL